MSRELLVIAALALVCIILAPFYKENRSIKYPNDNNHAIVPHTIQNNAQGYIQAPQKTKNPKTIVFLSDAFLPGTFAGSELSGYETMKYLRECGHKFILFIENPKAEEYDGFKLHKYDLNNEFCKRTLLNADIVFFQMKDDPVKFKIIEDRKKPIYIMIHVVNCYHWLLPQKVPFPVTIVYNSRMTQDSMPTIHDNMRMVPYVNIKPFIPLRSYTIRNSVVCLINCNKNKGSSQFNELAIKMSDVQFLGVKGGYAQQDIMPNPPKNLTYMDNQKDVKVVYKKIGILLMPSKNETWGRTAVEAMASGVPVIHSEAAGLVECVGGAGILCQRDDIDAWADAIRRILGDPAYREHLRQNGFRRVKEIEDEQHRGLQELSEKIEMV